MNRTADQKVRLIIALMISAIALFFAACSAPTGKSAPAPVASATAGSAPRGMFDHGGLEKILATYVNDNGWVDYAGLLNNRAALDDYLKSLATASPPQFPNDAERLAFWMNAYNAFTVADVLDDVYQKHQSVREVKGFFDTKKHRLAGEDLTLDQIEKRGRELKDPRIHFGVVCASTSCPKLQRFAYTGPQLEEQLSRITREFLTDPSRGLRADRDRNEVHLSSIFKWYAGDFTMSSSVLARVKAEVSGSEVLDYVKKHAPAEVVQFIIESNPTVKYIDYDWSLNAQETHR
ncbi:MAG: DUF547 domain-containing protein [Blastocatellia bacterium]